MKNQKIRIIIFLLISGFFLFVDQFLKYFARNNTDFTYYLYKPWLGWEYFTNSGIAFSLPFPNAILIIFTPLIILGLAILLIKQCKKKKSCTSLFSLGLLLIIFGAISNFIDRIIFEVTIDYIRLITSVINIADVMIVFGAGLVVFGEWKGKTL